MTEKMVNISVGLRLSSSEMADFQTRNQRVLDTLLNQNGRVEITIIKKENYTEIEYRALIPASQARGHHNFDSKLNKTWPDGAGAGWVEES